MGNEHGTGWLMGNEHGHGYQTKYTKADDFRDGNF